MARGTKTGGRTKGTVNKLSADLKEMILCSLHGVGGIKYLQEQAIKNPSPYISLLGKVLPTTLANDSTNPLIPPTPLTDQDRDLIKRMLEKGTK